MTAAERTDTLIEALEQIDAARRCFHRGVALFRGPANQDANGNYYVMNMTGSSYGTAQSGDGLTWSTGYAWDQGYIWSSGYVWTQSYAWSKAYAWSKNYAWSKGYAWSKSVPWWPSSSGSVSASAPASILPWVPNQ